MIPGSALIAVAAVGISMVVSGLLVLPRGARLAGSMLALAGLTMIGSCLLVPADHDDLAQVGLTVAGAVLVPLALTAYPRLHWRHPVDFVALVAVVGAGLLAVARWSDVSAVATMGLVIVMVLIASIWWRIE